ncbi:hypothetical protein SAMN05444722_0250 [Rhodovulum sp. ES.010]|uniref:hypothetical protein n=1 Tax=Rhodovulum sp. ES.010 TaxID=1882821 RepID=UPI0009298708|nr:hypothetical protein [Rhodovulum sp. ES.010]SIO05365.1 hypothetical protein SAMN05444722_0250 [Rhodovulum sp. ES.010]
MGELWQTLVGSWWGLVALFLLMPFLLRYVLILVTPDRVCGPGGWFIDTEGGPDYWSGCGLGHGGD